MNVRVVDDDQSILMLLEVLFEADGIHPIITGSDFARLFDPACWEDIDGALVDGHLGGKITGFDILNYLKENHPHIKRVLFTAMDLHSNDVEGLADVLLTKPAKVQDVVEAFTS